ncbi:zinc finger protein 638-like isoform X2 [Antennarius striatus]|uniref:zinc finger protein 638-like isoform X2 n=1 Tax=Antennarius striatus TaxID=241820 RepID=UPI0035B4E3E4
MYHHHSQQGSQPFPNGPRPPHRQPTPNQHQNRPASGITSQVMGFQFPRPTQLPDELESALAIRGGRDMDHRVIDHLSQLNQNQNQSSGSGIGQHGSYSSTPIPLTSENQPSHQQGVDWSNYQPPNKLFAGQPSNASHLPQRHQGPPQQPQSSHTGTSNPTWTGPAKDSPSPQAHHPHGGGGDGQGLYTPESAGSILASFGLSNEDLEVLSHYPDEQLTPDTLPFILRDIQINKSGNQKTMGSTSVPSFSHIHDGPLSPRSSSLARSHSPEVPSLLTVTQTAGKVIDYGHASRSKDGTDNRETFKREQLSSERTVKMYPAPSSSPSPKANKNERRHSHLEHTESSKHGDQDYRRMSREHRKSNRSPGREFPPSSKSRNLDCDYRRDIPKPRPSPEARSEASSRRSLSSSSGSKSNSSKKLPTPIMISDFSAASPKVYPHTCSLCNIPCDQEKDWDDHINTVNHTAACRDLRNKYPDWKPNLPSWRGQYGGRAPWHPKDRSPSLSVSQSLSRSRSPSPLHNRERASLQHHRPHGRSYSPYNHPRYQRFTGGSSGSWMKRSHDDSNRLSDRHRPSKVGHSSKHGPLQPSTKIVKNLTKCGLKNSKMANVKATDTTTKPPPAKKKKKIVTPTSQDSFSADRLVYLTGIPDDASEQEVTDMVRSFGKINNVILMPCSEEESEKGLGQKASVCMLMAGHAQALANATNLSIRGQKITASVAKKPESGNSSDAPNRKPSPGQDKVAPEEDSVAVGGEAEGRTADEKGIVLITGLPEGGWSENDIINLVQPFGTPCDIILASQIGKALVSVLDRETAQEMVKINSFIPMKINDCELKMIHVKQSISFTTPVALYNLLVESVDPLESSVPVGWSSLVVINNVPSTPTGSSEVQKLVQRFGTVIKTLVLNSMVICEMATAAMALSVYKRFQTFPCIIHNNPLIFSRKPDPKVNIQNKVFTYLDSSEETAANGKGNKVGPAETDKQKKNSELPLEGIEKSSEGKDEEMKNTEITAGEGESLGQNMDKDMDKKDGLAEIADSSAEAHVKPRPGLETDMKEKPENVTETPEGKGDISESNAGNYALPTGEEVKVSHSDYKAASPESATPVLPKVTQEMVNALLVECRTISSSHSITRQDSLHGEGEEMQVVTEQGEKIGETGEPAKNETVKGDMKKKEGEQKQREMKERARRAKKEKDNEDRARKEREKREEERRPWVKRERERKRVFGECLSGSRISHRSEGHRQREERLKAKPKMVQEETDDFPFNMSDFVTVDEVGDVTDLPCSPSSSVPMETTESDVPQEAPRDMPVEVPAETEMSDATIVLVNPDEHQSEHKDASADNTVMSSDVVLTAAASPVPVSGGDSCPSQKLEPEQPEIEHSSNDLERSVLTTKSDEDDKDKDLTFIQSKEDVVVLDKNEEHQKEEKEDKNITSVLERGKQEMSESQTHTEEESVKHKMKMETPKSEDSSLPPFDPSNPVGMEFLVPKIGFLCKPCNRFFTGSKEAEVNHCKTLKHYNSLQKYLQTESTVNATATANSS